MTQRARSFGAVAAAYERFRPGYPSRLVDLVLTYADRPVLTALEIGAGTGKATRLFAAREIAVTATDPDPAMLAELRRHVPSSVRTAVASLEELPLTTSYDLVYAAASLHWTRPEGRCDRLAALLTSGGVVASFGGQVHLADEEVEQAVRAARAPFLDDDDVPSPDGTPEDAPMQWPGTELAATTLFNDVRQQTIERRTTVDAQEYVDQLGTVSAYLELSDDVRRSALAAVSAALPERVDLRSDVTLHLARRR